MSSDEIASASHATSTNHVPEDYTESLINRAKKKKLINLGEKRKKQNKTQAKVKKETTTVVKITEELSVQNLRRSTSK